MTAQAAKPRAFITGATGFVGSRVARHLVASGWDVCAVVRPDSKMDQLNPGQHHIETIKFDGDIQALTGHLKNQRPEVVFHLASLFLAHHRPEDIPALIQANLTFGTQLLEAMSATGITRLVSTGTGWEHYNNSPYLPVNLYAATKQAFETIMAYYCDAHGLRAITLKIFDSYGPGDPRPKLIPALHRAAREQKPLEMSPGEQLMDMVYVDDIAEAFVVAAQRTATLAAGTHERFALSGGRRVTLRQLVEEMKAALNIDIPVRFGVKPYRPREVMVPWTDGRALPGWSAKVSLAEGLRRCFGSDANARRNNP